MVKIEACGIGGLSSGIFVQRYSFFQGIGDELPRTGGVNGAPVAGSMKVPGDQ